MFSTLMTLFIAALIGLALIGYLSDRQAQSGNTNLTPGLTLLPGDIKWQNESGNVKVYFPITTSIVLSVVLSLAMWLFR
jgi:Protein of unknown function (DUF2905)